MGRLGCVRLCASVCQCQCGVAMEIAICGRARVRDPRLRGLQSQGDSGLDFHAFYRGPAVLLGVQAYITKGRCGPESGSFREKS